jgi:hypothetical protein
VTQVQATGQQAADYSAFCKIERLLCTPQLVAWQQSKYFGDAVKELLLLRRLY